LVLSKNDKERKSQRDYLLEYNILKKAWILNYKNIISRIFIIYSLWEMGNNVENKNKPWSVEKERQKESFIY
jgi:hypothetical protein